MMEEIPRWYGYSAKATYAEASEQLSERELVGGISTQKLLRDFTDVNTYDGSTQFLHALDNFLPGYLEDAENFEYTEEAEINDVRAMHGYFLTRKDDIAGRIDRDDEDDYFVSEFEYLTDFEPYLYFMTSTRLIVEQGLRTESTDVRQQFVDNLFQAYTSGDDGATRRETFLAGSYKTIVDFINFYHRNLESTMEETGIMGKMREWRNEYVDFLTQYGAEYGSSASNERAVKVTRDTPIIIDDPLSTLSRMLRDRSNKELYGWFDPLQRTVYVDPFTIGYRVSEAEHEAGISDEQRLPEIRDLRVRKTLLHELIHAYTDHIYYYQVSVEDIGYDSTPSESKSMNAMGQWPHYWYEGMTEKIALMHLAHQLGEDVSKHIVWDDDPEIDFRRNIDSRYSTDQTMLFNGADILKRGVTSSYSDYRALIDSIFHNLDWEMAGLSQEEAERLAIGAFLEVPEDCESPISSLRLSFIQAVNKASHPGFFMKVDNLVENHGAHMPIIMMSSRMFDSNDPKSIPFVSSKQFADHLKKTKERTEINMSRLYKANRIAKGDPILKNQAEYLKKELVRIVAMRALLMDAMEAQYTILVEQYQPYSRPEDRLLRAIYGGGDTDAYDDAQSKLNAWTDYLNGRTRDEQ